jgi:hypothetical protein
MGEKVKPDVVLKHKQCRDMTTSESGALNLKPLSLGTPIVKLLEHVFAQTTTFRIAEAGLVVKVNIVVGVHGLKDFKTCCCQDSL